MESLGEASAPDRTWVSTFVSVAVHVAALWFISTGQPGGVPWGAPGGTGQIYSLNYLGEYVGTGAGSGRQESQAAAVVVPAKEGRDRVVTKAEASGVRPVTREAGRPTKQQAGEQDGLLASERGDYAIPVKPKAKEPSKQGTVEPVAVPSGVGTGVTGLQPGGGSGEAGGAAGPPPPRGTGMVAGLPHLVYPKELQNQEIKGTVGLKVTVDRDGQPTAVAIESKSGDPRLDEYARRAVQRGLRTKSWVSPYVLRVEARFAGGAPEIRVLDEPVEVGG